MISRASLLAGKGWSPQQEEETDKRLIASTSKALNCLLSVQSTLKPF